MRLWILCVLPAAFVLPGKLHAQDTLSKNAKVVVAPSIKKAEGTYTVQMINTRDLPLLPYNIDQIVEENRDAEKVVYKSLSKYVRIKILPKSEITKKDFVPVKSLEYVTE